MRKLALSTSAAAILIAAAAGSAVAQDATGTPPAQLTCSDISTLEAAHAAALVYYVAGYIDAQGAAAGGAMAAGGGEAAPADQA
ncbi:MAG TPA: hypothetical protein GYA10_14270, partial [Alphaproteobacteria bacterium]|nr:hypothetical protein [Alphaproteobacteria bacterium]